MSVKKLMVVVLIISWIQVPGIGWSEEKKPLKEITKEFMEKQKESQAQDNNNEPRRHTKKWSSPIVPFLLVAMGGFAEWGGFQWIKGGLEDLRTIKSYDALVKEIAALESRATSAGGSGLEELATLKRQAQLIDLPARGGAYYRIGYGAAVMGISALVLYYFFAPSAEGSELAINFGSEIDNLENSLHNKVVADAFVNLSEKGNALVRAPENSLIQEEFLLHQVLLARAQQKPEEEVNYWTSQYVDVRGQQKTLAVQNQDKESQEVAMVYAKMQQDQVRETIAAAIAQ